MTKVNSNLIKFENIIGVQFKNKYLLKEALTHSSYANQKNIGKFNERLEFLGDAVLDLIISEYLFLNCKDKPEGDLTKLRAMIVCENSLHKVALKWQVGKFMFLSRGEENTGGRKRVSILANSVESVIAAIYLDHGMSFTREFVIANFKEIIYDALENKITMDYKTKLQEVLQKKGDVSIGYAVVDKKGPPHRPTFYVELRVNEKLVGRGKGHTKKEAEQNAAKYALEEKYGK